jgi:predicted GNAT superfamily acetyltransferase
MSTESGVTIHVLSSFEDYHHAEELQRDIWGWTDLMEVTPLALMLTAQKSGGLAAGAFTPSGQMIGLVFGFMGLTKDGKFKHCSHQMGILPEYRREGIGEALKRFQREYVLAQGAVDLITWTCDPLEGVNASLNISRLGGIVRTYYENLYGDMPDALNSGLYSDRFEVEWWIASPRVKEWTKRERSTHASLCQRGAQTVNGTSLDSLGALHPVSMALDLDAKTLLVEIPAEFQAIKMVSMDLARQWRAHTREIFHHYFERGYSVTDFVSDREEGRRRNFYVLTSVSQT